MKIEQIIEEIINIFNFYFNENLNSNDIKKYIIKKYGNNLDYLENLIIEHKIYIIDAIIDCAKNFEYNNKKLL